jgi:hypothetical protein
MLAAEFDTSVTTLITYLLEEMPAPLKSTRYPPANRQSEPHQSPETTAKPAAWQCPQDSIIEWNNTIFANLLCR